MSEQETKEPATEAREGVCSNVLLGTRSCLNRCLSGFLIHLLVALILNGCISETEHGKCVGISDEKDPDLIYKINSTNITIGILFMGLVAPPIIVLVDEIYCPVGKKTR